MSNALHNFNFFKSLSSLSQKYIYIFLNITKYFQKGTHHSKTIIWRLQSLAVNKNWILCKTKLESLQPSSMGEK